MLKLIKYLKLIWKFKYFYGMNIKCCICHICRRTPGGENALQRSLWDHDKLLRIEMRQFL